jgi:hypothetical protein
MSSIKHMAVLNALHLNGPQDYLALERILGMAGLHRLTNYLQQQCLIAGLPKKAGELRKYKLTELGKKVIGVHVQRQVESTRNVMSLPKYEPKIFIPARLGALDASQIKSRGIGA